MFKLLENVHLNHLYVQQEQNELHTINGNFHELLLQFHQTLWKHTCTQQIFEKFIKLHIIDKFRNEEYIDFTISDIFATELIRTRTFEILDINNFIDAKQSRDLSEFLLRLRNEPKLFSNIKQKIDNEILTIIVHNIFVSILFSDDNYLFTNLIEISTTKLFFENKTLNQLYYLYHMNLPSIKVFLRFLLCDLLNNLYMDFTNSAFNDLISKYLLKFLNNLIQTLIYIPKSILRFLNIISNTLTCNNEQIFVDFVLIDIIIPALICPESYGICDSRLDKQIRQVLVKLTENLSTLFRHYLKTKTSCNVNIDVELIDDLFLQFSSYLRLESDKDFWSSYDPISNNNPKYLLFRLNEINHLLELFQNCSDFENLKYLPKCISVNQKYSELILMIPIDLEVESVLSEEAFFKRFKKSSSTLLLSRDVSDLALLDTFSDDNAISLMEDQDQVLQIHNSCPLDNNWSTEATNSASALILDFFGDDSTKPFDNTDNSKSFEELINEYKDEEISSSLEPLSTTQCPEPDKHQKEPFVPTKVARKSFFGTWKMSFRRNRQRLKSDKSDFSANIDDDIDNILNKYRRKQSNVLESSNESSQSTSDSTSFLETNQKPEISNDIDFIAKFEKILKDGLLDVDVLYFSHLPTELDLKNIEEMLQMQLTIAQISENRIGIVRIEQLIRCLQKIAQNNDSFKSNFVLELHAKLTSYVTNISTYIDYLVNFKRKLLKSLTYLNKMEKDIVLKETRISRFLIALNIGKFLYVTCKDTFDKFLSDFQSSLLVTVDEKVMFLNKFKEGILSELTAKHPIWKSANYDDIQIAESNLKLMIYSQIYVYAKFPTGDVDIHKDKVFEEHINKLSKYITPQNKYLQINPIFLNEYPWSQAQVILSQLNIFKNPEDKVKCIVNCLSTIINLLSLVDTKKTRSINADDFIPVLIYVIIMANPQYLLSNVQFVNNFSPNLSGEQAFYWTQFSSAVEFIKTMYYD